MLMLYDMTNTHSLCLSLCAWYNLYWGMNVWMGSKTHKSFKMTWNSSYFRPVFNFIYVGVCASLWFMRFLPRIHIIMAFEGSFWAWIWLDIFNQKKEFDQIWPILYSVPRRVDRPTNLNFQSKPCLVSSAILINHPLCHHNLTILSYSSKFELDSQITSLPNTSFFFFEK